MGRLPVPRRSSPTQRSLSSICRACRPRRRRGTDQGRAARDGRPAGLPMPRVGGYHLEAQAGGGLPPGGIRGDRALEGKAVQEAEACDGVVRVHVELEYFEEVYLMITPDACP